MQDKTAEIDCWPVPPSKRFGGLAVALVGDRDGARRRISPSEHDDRIDPRRSAGREVGGGDGDTRQDGQGQSNADWIVRAESEQVNSRLPRRNRVPSAERSRPYWRRQ